MPQRGGQQHQPSVMDVFSEIVQLLSSAKLLPDAQANMPAIEALEKGVIQIVNAMRTRTAQQATQGPQPGGGPPGGGPPGMGGMGGMGGPGMGGMGGGPPGGGGPGEEGGPPGMGGMAQQIAPGGGAGMSGFGTPNPDELRRTLAGPARAGVGS